MSTPIEAVRLFAFTMETNRTYRLSCWPEPEQCAWNLARAIRSERLLQRIERRRNFRAKRPKPKKTTASALTRLKRGSGLFRPGSFRSFGAR